MTEWTPQSKASTWTESNFRPSWCKALVMNLVMSIFSVLKGYYRCITNIYCPNHWDGIPTGYMLDWQLRCCIKLYDSSDFPTLIQIAVAPVNVLLMPCDIFYFYRATEIRANTRYGEAPPWQVITCVLSHSLHCTGLSAEHFLWLHLKLLHILTSSWKAMCPIMVLWLTGRYCSDDTLQTYIYLYLYLKGYFTEHQRALINYKTSSVIHWMRFFLPQSSLDSLARKMMSNIIGVEFGLLLKRPRNTNYLFCIFAKAVRLLNRVGDLCSLLCPCWCQITKTWKMLHF